MDRYVGPKATSFLSREAFEQHEGLCRQGSIGVFDSMATMGRSSEIVRVRVLLKEDLEDAKIRCAHVEPTFASSAVHARVMLKAAEICTSNAMVS